VTGIVGGVDGRSAGRRFTRTPDAEPQGTHSGREDAITIRGMFTEASWKGRIGIIGGSGLGDALEQSMSPAGIERVLPETPFGRPSDEITLGTIGTGGGTVAVALLKRHGRGHRFNPSRVPYRANIFALKSVGCTHIVASGACGSLRKRIRPGQVVVCDQLIDRTVGRDRTFYDSSAVHVEFADPCCPVMRRWLLAAADRTAGRGPVVHDGGTYVCIEGPSFSTRAEAIFNRRMGADVVGMTALPEARLAREAEIAYALLALPTDDDCWRPRPKGHDETSLLEEIIANLGRSVEAALSIIRAALADTTILRERPSPAHDALKHAIWTHRSEIPAEELARLGVLWGTRIDG